MRSQVPGLQTQGVEMHSAALGEKQPGTRSCGSVMSASPPASCVRSVTWGCFLGCCENPWSWICKTPSTIRARQMLVSFRCFWQAGPPKVTRTWAAQAGIRLYSVPSHLWCLESCPCEGGSRKYLWNKALEEKSQRPECHWGAFGTGSPRGVRPRECMVHGARLGTQQ